MLAIFVSTAQLCGINGVGMYTNMIFMMAGFSQNTATLSSTIVYGVQFLVALVGVSCFSTLSFHSAIIRKMMSRNW